MVWPKRLQGLAVPLGVVTGWWLMSVSSPVAAAVAPDPVTVLTALWGELRSGAVIFIVCVFIILLNAPDATMEVEAVRSEETP